MEYIQSEILDLPTIPCLRACVTEGESVWLGGEGFSDTAALVPLEGRRVRCFAVPARSQVVEHIAALCTRHIYR